MHQIFFLAEHHAEARAKLLDQLPPGCNYHCWMNDAADSPAIGYVECYGDPELVIDHLESVGLTWIPNHHTNGNTKLDPAVAARMAPHGVTADDTVLSALNKVGAKAGRYMSPRRF